MLEKNSPLVSLIIPVYNAEQCIEACVKSVLSQAYTNLELILIDDGSTDRSRIVCEELRTRDGRIRIFSKNNGGPGSARNYGLSQAKGDYCCFIDSDDFVGENYVSDLLRGVVNDEIDLVVHGVTFTDKQGDKVLTVEDGVVDGKDYHEIFNVREVHNFGFTVSKLYKMSLVKQFNIRFPESYRIAEDLFFFLSYLSFAEKVNFQKISNYRYVSRDSSLTNELKSPLEYYNRYSDLKGLLKRRYLTVYETVYLQSYGFSSLRKSFGSIIFLIIKADSSKTRFLAKEEWKYVGKFDSLDKGLIRSFIKYFKNPFVKIGFYFIGKSRINVAKLIFNLFA